MIDLVGRETYPHAKGAGPDRCVWCETPASERVHRCRVTIPLLWAKLREGSLRVPLVGAKCSGANSVRNFTGRDKLLARSWLSLDSYGQ